MDEAAIISSLKAVTDGLNTVSSDLKALLKELKTATAAKQKPASKESTIDIKDTTEIIKSLKKNSQSDSLYKFLENISKTLNKRGDLFELVKDYIDKTKAAGVKDTKPDNNTPEAGMPLLLKNLDATLKKLTSAILKIKPSTRLAQTEFLASLGQFVKDLSTTTTVTREESATDVALRGDTVQKVSVVEIDSKVLKQLQETYGERASAKAAKPATRPTAVKKQFELFGKDVAKGITAVTKAAGKGMEVVAKGASKGMELIGNGLTVLGKGAGKGFEAVGKGIGAAIRAVSTALPALAAGLVALTPAIPVILTLSAAIVAIGFALRLATPALKIFADLIGNVVIKALETLKDVLVIIGDVYKTVFVEGIKQAGNIITAIGDAVSKVVATIAAGITAIVGKVVESVERLAAINPLKLFAVASGIVAISGALATFAAGQALAGLTGFATGLLGKITGQKGPLERIIELAEKSSLIKQAADSIKEISSSLQSLNKVNFNYVAEGIVTISDALMTLAKGTLVAGVGGFFSGLLGKITGQKGPLETLLEIADKSDKIKAAGDAIVGISNAFRTFKYVDFDTIAEGITKVLKATQSKFSVGGFLNKITGQKNPLEVLIEFSKSAELLDKAATAVEKMSNAFAAFNNIDIEKIKELTKLPLGKLAAMAVLGSVLGAGAAAKAPVDSQQPGQIAAFKAPVESLEKSVKTAKDQATIKPGVRIGNVYDPTVTVKDNKVASREAGPLEREAGAEMNKISPALQQPDQFIKQTDKIQADEKLLEKLDELIASIKQPVINTAATAANSSRATAIDSSSVNIYNSSSDRDIPYVERNKYRQQLLYIRGIL